MIASPGKKFFCMMCGKTAVDTMTHLSWDESCDINSVEIDLSASCPTSEQAQKFHEERNNFLSRLFTDMDDMIKQLTDGTYTTDPELLKLIESFPKEKQERLGLTNKEG